MEALVGVVTADKIPEACGVVHLKAVAQLVNHHVVEHLGRGEHEQHVKVEVARRRAAAPARFLSSQGYAAIGHAYLGGEVLHACRDYQAGLARKRRKVLLGQQALLLDGLSTRLLAGLHTRK